MPLPCNSSRDSLSAPPHRNPSHISHNLPLSSFTLCILFSCITNPALFLQTFPHPSYLHLNSSSPAPRTSPVSPLPVPAYTHSPSVSHTCPNAPFSPPPFPSKPSYHSPNAQPLPNLYLPPLAPSSSSSGRSPLTAVAPPPPGSHTLQDWRRCLAIFLTVTTLPQYWQLTLLPTPPPTSTPTRPTPSAPPPAPSSTQIPSPPHPQPCPYRLLPRHPLPQLPPIPQPCKTARDGRNSHRIPGLCIPHTPSACPPTSSPPRTSYDSRRGRPSSPPPGHSPRTRTSLSFLSPIHHTFIPHQTISRPAQPLTPLIPTPQVLNHSPLVPHKPLVPVSPHVPMRKLPFIHTYSDDPFSLSPTSSIRSCRSLTYQHPSNLSPLHSKSSSNTTQSSSFSQAPNLPLTTSCTTQVLPLSSDSHPSFTSHVLPSLELSSQSSIAQSSPPASLSHHTCSLAPAIA